MLLDVSYFSQCENKLCDAVHLFKNVMNELAYLDN